MKRHQKSNLEQRIDLLDIPTILTEEYHKRATKNILFSGFLLLVLVVSMCIFACMTNS